MHVRAALAVVIGMVSVAAAEPPLSEVQMIALPGVKGRIEHCAVDPAGNRLFGSALGNHTLEVLDVAADKRITSIKGLVEPQGVAYVPAVPRIVVALRGGSVASFADKSYERKAPLADHGDSDNQRYAK